MNEKWKAKWYFVNIIHRLWIVNETTKKHGKVLNEDPNNPGNFEFQAQ